MRDVRIPQEKCRLEVLGELVEEEHFHQDIELLFILEGKLDVSVGESVTHMAQEDILVINANKRHMLKGTKDVLYAKLTIQWQLMSDVFHTMDVLFWCNSTLGNNDRYDELRNVLKKLLNHYLSSHGDTANFGHISLCYQTMDLLAVHFFVHSSDRVNQTEKDKYDNRIAQINNYIRAHYNTPISLNELADKLYLSVGYLSRFFKKNYGMNFASYLENIRMYYAMEELLYTDKPITRIVFDNGFSSVAAFNKVFKEINGETPSVMRKRHRELPEKMISTKTEYEIETRLEEFFQKGETEREEPQKSTKAELSVSGPFVKTQCSWNDMINIGSAADLLKSEVREHVMLLKGALDFSYIRFWNVFSAEMLLNEVHEEGTYNFSKIDSILDFLMAQGLKPHFELGLKPKRIQRNVQTPLLNDHQGSAILTYTQMIQVLHAVLRHLIHRYNRQEIDSWRMELWFDEKEWNQGELQDEYIRSFDGIYEILKSYSDTIEVGGCGLRLNRETNSILSFLKKWYGSKYRPDFISACFYSYEQGKDDRDEFAKRSTDNEYMFHCVENFKKLVMESGFMDTPIYLTEWNLTISDRNFINDTCFKGAYIAKNMLDIYGLTEVSAYFLGSDRVSEYYDSGDFLYGGNGLLSKDGILKPAGFAFDFLNHLHPYFVGKGANYMVTANGKDSYGIICHNQKALNYHYYFIQEDQVEKEHIWKYFEERESLELNLRLVDLEDGIYKMQVYRLNEQSGSVLDIWRDMGFEYDLSRNDIKYFLRVCEPKLIIHKQEVKDQVLDIHITLSANEIAFIRLRKVF